MAPSPAPQNTNDMISLSPASPPPAPDFSPPTSSSGSPLPSKPRLSRSRAKKLRNSTHLTHPSIPSLRPAGDVLLRIRHDPALTESDFVIGYRDRHVEEVLEIEVAEWKWGDVTDEKWIPQHRILYFRRKSDGEGEGKKMWDRGERIDEFFGSGLGTGCQAVCEERKLKREDKESLKREEASDGPRSCSDN